ncbi:MAG TPA: hypothetical protein VJA23_01610 [Candidatus Nanoarchaeia archaeon]|nr:hypothetical protein [Candidatus Nanoarchaeia archaeon]
MVETDPCQKLKKAKSLLIVNKRVPTLFTMKRKKRKKLGEIEIDPDSDFPVHEKYTKEEPVKE